MTKSKYDLSGNPIKSYGNVAEGCPITMDMGCFKLYYRAPICGGNRMFLSAHTATVKDFVRGCHLMWVTCGPLLL